MSVDGPRVVAIGDSVTLGVGDGMHRPGSQSGWAAHVAHGLGASRFANLAANGVRARHLMEAQVPAALMHQPDVVLMTAGGNDVLRGDFSPAEITAHVSNVLDRLERPGRVVAMLTLDRIGLFDLMGARIARVMAARIDRANEALRRACAGRSVHLLDGASVFEAAGAAAWHVDRIHPSQVGHRALATATLDAVATSWPHVVPLTPPRAIPGLAARAAWLAWHGAPWIAKRSVDLIPQVTRVVTHELRADKRAREQLRAGAAASPSDQPGVLLHPVE